MNVVHIHLPLASPAPPTDSLFPLKSPPSPSKSIFISLDLNMRRNMAFVFLSLGCLF